MVDDLLKSEVSLKTNRLCPVKCFLISKTISAHKIHNSLVYETNTILKQLISKLFTFFFQIIKVYFQCDKFNSIQFNYAKIDFFNESKVNYSESFDSAVYTSC